MQLKAYDPTWAWHLLLRAQADRWQRRELLSAAQHAAIVAAYPLDYYRPAWPLRVALFFFTWLAISMGCGFAYPLFDLASDGGFPLMVLIAAFCGGCFLVLELSIRSKKLFRAGVDNAMLYAALLAGVGLIFYVFTNGAPTAGADASLFAAFWPIGALLFTLALLLAAVVRYADAVVLVVAFVVFLALVAFVALFVHAAVGRAGLPFLLMLAAAAVYKLQQRFAARPDAYYYHSCLSTAKALALVFFYLAGNYFIVREGNAQLGNFASQQIPLAPLFYVLTAIIPLAYVVWGLRRHDRLLLLIGLLGLAFSLFTLRYYRSLLPPEIAATLGGAVLVAVAGATLRYLRPARHGLTSLPDDEPQHFNLESLVVAQTASVPGAPTPGFAFGGGQSGGGGATGQF